MQKVLDKATKRWVLDEVITNVGKPSEVYYLVRLGKSMTRDDLITAIRAKAGRCLIEAPIEDTGPLTVERMGDGNLWLNPVTEAD